MKKNLVKYILPAAMVAGFLCFFFYDAFHYKDNIDDAFNAETLSKLSIADSIQLFFNAINGRWVSHIITAFAFYFLRSNYVYYAFYETVMMLLFVFSVSILYKNYTLVFLKKIISIKKSLWFSFVFTATLYFLLFDGRQEIWAWVSSVNNHLFSVTLCLLLFSFLLKEKKSIVTTCVILLLSTAIGGLNEVNAICCILAIAGLLYLNKKQFPQLTVSTQNMLLAVFFISASLTINTFSGGYANRMNTLQDFTLPQSIKNTIHTFALPIMQYQLIVVRVLSLTIFLFFIEFDFSALKKTIKQNKLIVFGILCLAGISFFLHCYILSDIAPPRGEIWAYTLGLFMLFTSQKLNKNFEK